ncbi:MAG: hypothetical protein EOP04_25680 [Proteobacteria bacterium]|nr:MAG: hypothetical protein EOP04_25680 [Pseudomonadota bacterium]
MKLLDDLLSKEVFAVFRGAVKALFTCCVESLTPELVRLNCRGEKIFNHRWISTSQAHGLRGVQSTSKTGYKGVTPLPNGKYKVTIRGKHICCCDTAEEAAHVYNQRAKELGFVFLNTILEVK